MKRLLIVPTVFTAILVGGLASPAQANQCDRLTYLTFSEPVAMPGVTLPAGTYRFTHPGCAPDVLSVSSRDGLEVYGLFLTIPDEQLTPSGRPEVLFAEMPKGSPEAIVAWFRPGQTTGDELIYPKTEAAKVAVAPEQEIVATKMPPDGSQITPPANPGHSR